MTDHEVSVRFGASVTETIEALADLPGDARLFEHFGDLDLLLVYRQAAESEDPDIDH